MKKIFDIITWSVLSFLLIPSSLVLASWNSVPGDPLYAVKIGLEKTLLAVVPSTALQSSLQVNFTERRFDEASQVLDTSLATEGLTNLDQQLVATTLTISQVKNIQEQSQLADSYIQTLTKVSEKLEEKRQSIALAAPAITPAAQTAQPTQQAVQPIQTAPQSQNQQEQQTQQQTIQQLIARDIQQQQPVATPPSGKEEKTIQNSVAAPTVLQEIPKKTSSPLPLTTPTQQPKVQTSPQPSAPSATNTSVVNKTEVRVQIAETQHKIAEEIRKMQEIKREAEKHQVQQKEEEKKREDKQKDSEKKDSDLEKNSKERERKIPDKN